MQSPYATPKKPATGALLHPPTSAVGIARAAANEAKGKEGIGVLQAPGCRGLTAVMGYAAF